MAAKPTKKVASIASIRLLISGFPEVHTYLLAASPVHPCPDSVPTEAGQPTQKVAAIATYRRSRVGSLVGGRERLELRRLLLAGGGEGGDLSSRWAFSSGSPSVWRPGPPRLGEARVASC